MKVEIWTLSGGAHAAETARTLPVRYLNHTRALSAIFELAELLRTHTPSVMLSASFHTNCAAVLARTLARRNVRLVLAEHTALTNGLASLSFFKRLFAKICIRLFYPRADAWVAVSKDVAAQMAAYGRLSPDSVTVIYNPVITPELIAQSKVPNTHPFFETGEPILLTAGRLSVEKDHATLLAAFARANQHAPMRLIIAGDGPERDALEVQARQLDITDRVAFLGHVENPYPYFVRADLFVLSSKREGLPTVLVEALALGTPVVSTDARSGPREILNDGEYGMLVPVGDSAALAEAIIAALSRPKTAVPAGALDTYTVETATNAYRDVLVPR